MPASMHPLISHIFSSCSPPIPLSELESCSRGIYLHTPSGKKYFTKTQSDIKQMRGEVEGLRAMGRTTIGLGLIPELLGFEVAENRKESAMVTQYFDLGSPGPSSNVQKELGEKLAKMHNPPSPEDDDTQRSNGYTGRYGFGVPTHCGATEQDNTWTESWEAFYRDRRLGDLVRRIGDNAISSEWEKMKDKIIPLLLRSFDPPAKPVILHGDLWSGNKGYDTISGSAVIYDPASYFGHNEADLGITHMFGGFSKDFYEAYHAIHPRSQPYYDERQKLYELYHHLNHTLMFGGSYKSGTLSIMRSLNAWADDQDKEIPIS
ncbi:uncharacterized protein I303_108182 [Kwoniella dejecticola CBS 10117]|uniref:protein-ribulosamine 3-kinase n=1 Tax=Kwoniella dejecticola CBS 10117 TaxID=1296121 RepID=A0A1A5ZY35_9TREE|nr:fructosamine kinase [Kwoniella dejecticola CBS 10117]OBR82725.1 fructosamine kinase [Kwoniella dejecticola CBS 10117]